jgi:hypothetical protein
MKVKHWIGLLFAVIGIVFVIHMYMGHGGTAGVKQGLGIG